MQFSKLMPFYVIQLFKRLGITLIMLTLTRIIFLLANLGGFHNIAITDFLVGIWVDCITIGIWFIPFYFFSLIPNGHRDKNYYQTFLKVVFHLTNSLIIAFNLIDVEYFKYTSKRSTADLFTILGAGEDFSQLIGSFITDFWWLILTFTVLIIISNKLYKKTSFIQKVQPTSIQRFYWLRQVVVFLFFSTLLFIMGRGGLGYRPADMLTAAKFTKVENTALVLNTPLTIIKTIGKESLKEKKYFDEDEQHLIYNPSKIAYGNNKVANDLNIMVIVLESFGNEWIGVKNGGNFTPFLDSLIRESLYFSNAYANGRKSIEAMPAIFAGIPSLLDNPYISSHYGTNSIEALPLKLKKKGYSSAFYHGATNGSMKFDEFAALAGFDHYFGRYEYNNEEHCDDTWGVLDEYFNPWTAESITRELKEPFFAGLFTLSSHHPYFIPEEHRNNLPEGPEPIAKSIAYGDMSLKLFFDKAKEQPWFENTIFILCADHTPAGTSSFFRNRIGMYQIPIVIYDPKKRIKPTVNDKIFSHIDIYPTVLDFVGYKGSYYSFGNSFFNKNKKWTVNYISGSYHYFYGDYLLNFSNEEAVNLYNYKLDPLMNKDSISYFKDFSKELEVKIKGIIQRYNHDLINNQMTAE